MGYHKCIKKEASSQEIQLQFGISYFKVAVFPNVMTLHLEIASTSFQLFFIGRCYFHPLQYKSSSEGKGVSLKPLEELGCVCSLED